MAIQISAVPQRPADTIATVVPGSVIGKFVKIMKNRARIEEREKNNLSRAVKEALMLHRYDGGGRARCLSIPPEQANNPCKRCNRT